MIWPPGWENLYYFDSNNGKFVLGYKERNKAYKHVPDDSGLRVREQEEEVSERKQELELTLPTQPLAFKVNVVPQVTERWGIKFVATVEVEQGGPASVLYLPGVLTFDPAGITGDSHSSERIGPSCARVQTAVTVAQLFVLQHGGTQADIDAVQQASAPMINAYNGRLCQWKWMRQQVREVGAGSEVTPYPAFLQGLVDSGELNVEPENRAMTREFLQGYKAGVPVPPMAYFLKVNEKGCSCFKKL